MLVYPRFPGVNTQDLKASATGKALCQTASQINCTHVLFSPHAHAWAFQVHILICMTSQKKGYNLP